MGDVVIPLLYVEVSSVLLSFNVNLLKLKEVLVVDYVNGFGFLLLLLIFLYSSLSLAF